MSYYSEPDNHIRGKEVDKLDINKLLSVPTGLNNLKTKVDELDVGKLKPVIDIELDIETWKY